MISRFTATRHCDIINKPELESFLRQCFSLHLTAKYENEMVHSNPSCQNGLNLGCFLLGGHDLSKTRLSVKYKVCHANEIHPCFNLKVIIVGAFICSRMQKGETL